MAKRKTHQAHNGHLWARLCQLIKVEEPIRFEAIQRLCPDVDLRDLDYALREMCAAQRINVARHWQDSGRMVETCRYGDGSFINAFDEHRARLQQQQQQRARNLKPQVRRSKDRQQRD
jgi:hypothetical protein